MREKLVGFEGEGAGVCLVPFLTSIGVDSTKEL